MFRWFRDDKEFNKFRKKKAIINCITSIGIGALCFFVSIMNLIVHHDSTMMLFGIIALIAFIIAGIYLLYQPALMDKKNNNFDDPESKAYINHQKDLEFRKNEYLKKTKKHRSLRYHLYIKKLALVILRSAIVAGIAWFFGVYFFVTVLLIIAVIGATKKRDVYAGKEYKTVLDEYQKLGFNKNEAEDDFTDSNVYIVDSSIFSVSRKTVIFSKAGIVLPVNSVVWVFTGYEKLEKDDRLSRMYHISILTDTGLIYQIICPEAVCMLMTEDIVSSGINVTTGYSDEMLKLYNTDPKNFRNALKPAFDIQYSPVNKLIVIENQE